MELGLQGRTAVVTGATQGLGLAVARGLAAEGANLVLNARGEARLVEVADELSSSCSVEVAPLAGDVRDDSLPDRLVSAALDRTGRLDIVVTNSGGPPKGEHDDLSAEDIRSGLELTIGAAMRVILAAVGPMKEAGWGRVIALTSMSAKEPIPGLIMSNVTRPGLLGFIKTLASEVARDGILCNAVGPGWTATPSVAKWIETDDPEGSTADEKRAELFGRIPLGRLAEPSEIADAVVYLASERSSYITGQLVTVDGGYVKGLF